MTAFTTRYQCFCAGFGFTAHYGFIAATCNLAVTFGDAHWASALGRCKSLPTPKARQGKARERLWLITPFTAISIQSRDIHSQNQKLSLKRTKFWTFFAHPNFKGAVTAKSCTCVITPTEQHVTCKSFIKLLPQAPKILHLIH